MQWAGDGLGQWQAPGSMKFSECGINGAWVIEPTPHEDARGRFMRAWCRAEFSEHAVDFTPLQANMALSIREGTIRGLHYQVAPALEAKLVRCTRGAIFDVVVDLRPGSPTYRSWYGTRLSADNGHMLYVPEGCAHGCQSLEDNAEIYYLASAVYAPGEARISPVRRSGIRNPVAVAGLVDLPAG